MFNVFYNLKMRSGAENLFMYLVFQKSKIWALKIMMLFGIFTYFICFTNSLIYASSFFVVQSNEPYAVECDWSISWNALK